MGKRKSGQVPGQLSLYDLEILPGHQPAGDMAGDLRHGDVKLYRVKTIRAGKMLDCEIYPVYTRAGARRAARATRSRAAQENLNHRNTKKHITRLINHNFTDADMWGTFGYDDAHLPPDMSRANKDRENFFKRLNRRRKKLGLSPMRYLYVTEFCNDGKKVRCHHHVIMSGDMDRDEVEKLWKGGAYPQTRRLRVKEDCALTGLASYLAKGKKHERKWGHSRNLNPYVVTVADHKLTRRMVERMVMDEAEIPRILEKKCRGYVFRQIEIKRSEFVAGAYLYAQMYRRC